MAIEIGGLKSCIIVVAKVNQQRRVVNTNKRKTQSTYMLDTSIIKEHYASMTEEQLVLVQ